MTPKPIEGHAPFGDYLTWYRITGELGSGKVPLVVVHGGPGCTHDYLDSYSDIAETGRAVIHYDQIGNGRSSHRVDAPGDFWNVALFLAEMDALLAHLGVASRYNLLGQSWGGMLGSEHAVRRPPGLNAFVVANSPSAMSLWVEGCMALRADLPVEARAALDRHEADGNYNHPEFQAASRIFYERHVCRLLPWPDEVVRTFDWVDRDPTVYHTMNGPTEFAVIGTMCDWTVIDRLHQIAAPTLVISGRHDEATPQSVQPFVDHIPGATWTIFENSSHMPHVEEREACMQTVADFLDRYDEE